ncbi:aldose 1-epimerase [Limnoglobus roseus]|uniref:Aldose 1-epimerase n=1 Tax=Limnoglobus roseus TaxID=2598579 RepID=A0A5C1AHG5_9BACT|nr:aldose 1-epimerase [Limnoglobus roseus]QEL18075.1 aldose 1-epimerase [Limnoglobus roseus]
MAFNITTAEVQAGDRKGTAYVLADATGCVRAEVWPTHGFNCLRWQVRADGGPMEDILFTAPDWDQNPVPTRSGHPVLFPFPNRMRAGCFTFQGKEYQLPLNESSGKHAIHGFTPRIPWRVVDHGCSADSAFVTGEFQISKDAPQAVDYWPADARLRLTYRLSAKTLRVEAVVDAADGKDLPFGIGYHPYFRAPGGVEGIADWVVTAHASTVWVLEEGLPTGQKIPAPEQLDFQSARSVDGVVLDTLYGTLSPKKTGNDPLEEVARLEAAAGSTRLVVAVDPVFRELLLFTPAHRKAVAIEPYTCANDAANLEANGTDAGWRVLPAGEVFRASVEYRLEPRNSSAS